MKSSWRTTWLKLSVVLLPVIACFLYFRYVVPYHTVLKEQLLLFVYSSVYFWSYFSKPAVLACLGGDFLTQFLFFKTGGAVVITLLLAVEWWLIFLILKRFFVETRHVASLPLWSLLPVMVEWIAWPHHLFSVTLSVSFILALSAFLITTPSPSLLRKRDEQCTLQQCKGALPLLKGGEWSFLILIPALYVLAGASVFLFLLLVVLYDIHCGRKRFVYRTIISGLAIAFPVFMRHSYLLSLRQAYLYPFPGIRQGLSLVALVLAILVAILGNCTVNTAKRRNARSADKWRVQQWLPLLGGGIGAVLLLMTGLVKTTDRKQEHLFGIIIEAYNKNWDKVLDIAESAELQQPVATCFINLALSQKDLLGERLMDFYQPFSAGLILPSTPDASWFAAFVASDAYYHIGDMDMAQHAAMIGMICTLHQRSARSVERLAEINMALGDMPAAAKYIRILESTLFHRTRSKSGIFNSDQRKAVVFREDVIRKASDIKPSLELLVKSDPDHLQAVNYLLCFYLLNKDISAFFKAYTEYCKGKYHPVPKVYAEALLIYFAGSNSTMKEVNDYGIHPEIIKSFGEYTRLYEASDGILLPMQEKFPNTYWLYFHFAVMNNE